MTYIPPHSINATAINTKMRHKRNANVPSPLSISTTMPISSNKTESPKTLSHHLSTAAESGITFISILLFGSVIIISVYSWKKFADSSWRYIEDIEFCPIILIYATLSLDICNAHFSLLPSTYQYSALTQYDNDRDEEINDLEDHLDILVEDSSSSDNEEDPSTKDILDINAVS